LLRKSTGGRASAGGKRQQHASIRLEEGEAAWRHCGGKPKRKRLPACDSVRSLFARAASVLAAMASVLAAVAQSSPQWRHAWRRGSSMCRTLPHIDSKGPALSRMMLHVGVGVGVGVGWGGSNFGRMVECVGGWGGEEEDRVSPFACPRNRPGAPARAVGARHPGARDSTAPSNTSVYNLGPWRAVQKPIPPTNRIASSHPLSSPLYPVPT
jgi:hypothetical protein